MKHSYKFSCDGLTNEAREKQLRSLLADVGIDRVDINLERRVFRVIASAALDIGNIKQRLAAHGFHVRNAVEPVIVAPITPPSSSVQPSCFNVCIEGMSCGSCEITIERAWKKLPGVKQVNVNAARGEATLTIDGSSPSIDDLQAALHDNKYRVTEHRAARGDAPATVVSRPSWLQLAGLFAFVLFIGWIFSRVGLLKPDATLGEGVGFWAAFFIGLVAASSSCLAVSGGLLLSSAAKFLE